MSNIDRDSEARLSQLYEGILGTIDVDVGRLKRAYKEQDNYQSLQLLEEITNICETQANEFFNGFCSELRALIESSVTLEATTLGSYEQRFHEYLESFIRELTDTVSETALASNQKGHRQRFEAEVENKVLRLKEQYCYTIEKIKSSKKIINLLGLFKSRWN